MIVPSSRLQWLVAILGFPAAIAAGLTRAALPLSIAVIGLIAAAAIADALRRGRALAGLRVEAPDLIRLFKDRDGEIRLLVRNEHKRGRLVRAGIVAPRGIEMPVEDQVVSLPAGAELSQIKWRVTPRRRGKYLIDACYLEAASPWGLWQVRRRDSIDLEVRVYPNLRDESDLRAFRRGLQGLRVLRQIGRGREFEKLREYVAGDGFDEIHWKATARRSRPITKVFQVERTQEIYLAIDASRLSGRTIGGDSALEAYLRTALLVGAAAEKRGDLFGLLVFSNQIESFTRARHGKQHYAACRDAIFQIQPRTVSPAFDEVAVFLRTALPRRALILFLTSLDDPAIAADFMRASRLIGVRHVVAAAMPRPTGAQRLFHDVSSGAESEVNLYRELAGHLAWRRLKELDRNLARQGVRLRLAEPGALTSAAMSVYDEVKQKQAL